MRLLAGVLGIRSPPQPWSTLIIVAFGIREYRMPTLIPSDCRDELWSGAIRHTIDSGATFSPQCMDWGDSPKNTLKSSMEWVCKNLVGKKTPTPLQKRG